VRLLLLLLPAVAACGPEPLVRVENATRMGELATGDLLIGTADGRLVGVNGFGESWNVEEDLGAGVRDVTTSPVGVWWVLLDDGRLLRGTPWMRAQEVRHNVLGVAFTCEGLDVGTSEAPGRWAAAASIAIGPTCQDVATGTRDGHIGEERVTSAAIVRLYREGDGYLWVDDSGRAGCHGCDTRVPADGVRDAWMPHGVPFLEGEAVWLDLNGTLWVR
jgi:hypothetical protein